MNFAFRMESESKKVCGVLLSSLLLVTAGCGRDEVKVYRAAKEEPATPRAPSPHVHADSELPAGHPDIGSMAKPQITWTLPEGWKEIGGGQMTVAAFSIADKTGHQAQVAITPLGKMAGKEALIVNMWRETAGLPKLPEEEALKQFMPVEVGSDKGRMMELTRKAEGTNSPIKIVTAMVHRDDATWFYKLAGDAELVEAQKPAFVQFLKSIKFVEAPATEVAATDVPDTEGPAGTEKWKTPLDWKAVSPGPMQAAKFTVPSKGSSKADVMISIFPNSTGNTLGNVNRWRNQISLPPVTEAELDKLVTKLDPKNPEAILVDFTNNERRLIGAIVPRGGQWYFFKLVGDVAAVAPQKDAFVAFVKSPQ